MSEEPVINIACCLAATMAEPDGDRPCVAIFPRGHFHERLYFTEKALVEALSFLHGHDAVDDTRDIDAALGYARSHVADMHLWPLLERLAAEIVVLRAAAKEPKP